MILYLIQSTLALTFLICIYFAFLRGSKSFHFNRFYLLASVLLSLLMPCLSLELSVSKTSVISSYQEVASLYSSTDYSTDNFLLLGKQKATPIQRFSYYFTIITYTIISGYLLLRFFVHLYLLLISTRKKGPILAGMQTVLVSRKCSPFSFFHFLFVSEKEVEQVQNNTSILLHEQAHVIQKHSIDVLFLEIIHCFFWFNPILILYKKAMKENHEYLADQHAIFSNVGLLQYQNDLLQAVRIKTYSPLTSSFSYYKIKNRIQMIQKKQPQLMQKAVRISFSFLLALTTLLICSFKPVALENQYVNLEFNLHSTTPSILPIAEKKIIEIKSSFGMRTNPFTKVKQLHTGVDISAPEGTNIIATADGEIVKVSYSGGYGNHIKIVHDGSYQTLYAHLESILVEEGQKVKAGDIIGVIGNSGKSLGTHLHYEVIKDNQKVNPADYFEY